MMPQSIAEVVLLQKLAHFGSSVLRPVTAVGLEQDEQGVTVELWDGSTRSANASRRSIVARYVVACDGLHSQIRSALDMAFLGSSAVVSFIAADVQLEWSLPRTEVQLFFSERGVMVVAPLPDDLYRILASVDPGDQKPKREQLQELIATRGPRAPAGVVREVVWSATYEVHDRVATHYRSGRVFLAGDAAHVHNPAAGQAMNAGIQDALNLADKLCDVISGRADASLLDRYEDERRPVAKTVLSVTAAMTRVATMRGKVAPRLRNRALRVIGSFPALSRRLAYRMSGLEGTFVAARRRAKEKKLVYVATFLFVALLLGTTFALALELLHKIRGDGAL
jgi:2-polyprenyl-6-methoxyphenol hydroxylase-like FAD-dependent oxidoreductase